MGAMSDLHALSGRVLDGDETVPEVAKGSAYPVEEIAWAVSERVKARA